MASQLQGYFILCSRPRAEKNLADESFLGVLMTRGVFRDEGDEGDEED